MIYLCPFLNGRYFLRNIEHIHVGRKSIFRNQPLSLWLNSTCASFLSMGTKHTLVFDEVMIKQLKKTAKNQQAKDILTKVLDKLEISGPNAGELLDSQLFIY